MLNLFSQWIKNAVSSTKSPLELIYFITNKCNLSCSHCFLYNTKFGPDLKLNEIESISKDLNGVKVFMITGGEPFIRNDIDKIINILSSFCHPITISVATNGQLTNTILTKTKNILNQDGFDSHLILTVSFDGTKKMHDKIRRSPGAFDKALKTTYLLKELSKKYKNLSVGANMTLTPENGNDLKDLCDFFDDKEIFDFISLNLMRGENIDNCFISDLDMNIYEELSRFCIEYSKKYKISKNPLINKLYNMKENFQSHLINKIYSTRSNNDFICEAGRGIGVLYPDGQVSVCELLPPIGSVRKTSFKNIWNSARLRKMTKELQKNRCFCTHECFLSAAINLQPAMMLRSIIWNLINHKRN